MLAKYIRAQLALAGLSFIFYTISMLVLGFPHTLALGVCRLFLLSCPVSAIEVDVSMLSMQGKNAVVFGVANKRSIAWAIGRGARV